jgi:hypothetical protein
MKNRCYVVSNKQFNDYGGRGIEVCNRWLEPRTGFHNFVADMGPRPTDNSLDRIDCNGNYEPSNCRWADRQTQQRNQRVSRRVIIEGVDYLACELAEKYGLKTDTIVDRARKGLPFAEVIDPKRRVYKDGLALGGAANGLRNKNKTHCKHGHPFDAENTYIHKRGRSCRACHAIREKQRKLASHL